MRCFNKDVNYWFIADTHFGHANIIKETHANRPFTSIEEHDKILIDNWNSVVQEDDVVFLLGDITFNYSSKKIDELFNKLTGDIYYVKGNHDRNRILKVYDRYMTRLENCEQIQINNQNYIISHYPIESWQGMTRGLIHIHGHTHGNEYPHKYNRFNASVENIEYIPINVNKIVSKFNKPK